MRPGRSILTSSRINKPTSQQRRPSSAVYRALIAATLAATLLPIAFFSAHRPPTTNATTRPLRLRPNHPKHTLAKIASRDDEKRVASSGVLRQPVGGTPSVTISLRAADATTEGMLRNSLRDIAGRTIPYGATVERAASAVNRYATALNNGTSRVLRHAWAGRFTGRGLVWTIPPEQGALLAVLASVTHLRVTLHVELPVEVVVGSWEGVMGSSWRVPRAWTLANQMLAGLQAVTFLSLRQDTILAAGAQANKFLWKLLAIMLSSFEEVLLVDSDNVPLRDPSPLFDHLATTGASALFWNDIWRLNRDAPLWAHLTGGRPPSGSRGLTQESGQLVVRKTDSSMRALLLATFMNVWSGALYPHIYCAKGAFGDPCDGFRLQHGAGDKDTFMIAWHMLGEPYEFMPTPSFYALNFTSSVCNVAHLPSGPDGQPAFMHHNLRKMSDGYGRPLHRLAESLVPGLTHQPQFYELAGVACQLVPAAQFGIADGIYDENEISIGNDLATNTQLCIHVRSPSATGSCASLFHHDFVADLKHTLHHLLVTSERYKTTIGAGHPPEEGIDWSDPRIASV